MFEGLIGAIVVGILEAVIFKVLWKKKAGPVRDALKTVVTAVKGTGATIVAKQVKKVTDKNPAMKKALDKIINEAHAYIKPEK
jgi:predicted transcriptional regulator